jgi:acyl-CoA thioesterase-2
MIRGVWADLASLLQVEVAGANRFLGGHSDIGRHRVYGGQFLGQGLMAAANDQAQPARSLHAYFIRTGTTDSPIEYRTERLAEDCVSVTATQQDRAIYTMDVLFGPLPPTRNQAPPGVPAPDQCIPRAEGIRGLPTGTDATWAVTDSPFDNRFVENIWDTGFRTAAHNVWFTVSDSVREAVHLQQAALAYYSDDTVMDNALFPHGWMDSWQNLQTTSLDHCLWFHAPVDLTQWILHTQDSPVAAGGRGMTRGRMVDNQGTLLASVAQEILMRSPL